MPTDGASGSTKLRWATVALAVGYVLLMVSTSGLSPGYLVIDVLFLSLAIRRETYGLLKLAVPLWLFAFVYSVVLPQALEWRGQIHVADLYNWELSWFGVPSSSGPRVPAEVFRDWHWPSLDLVCGVVYMTELVEPLLLAIWLFFRDRQRLPSLIGGFILLNLSAFATWVLYPAAPPWYVDQYGLGPAVLDAPSSAAGLLRLDDALGLGLVKGFYAQSVNVFGAMPSVHVAVPTLVACVTAGMGWRWFVPALVFLGLMAFGAVYFQHHYVLDVFAGLLYGMMSYSLVAGYAAWQDPRAKSNRKPPELICD